MAGNDYYIPVEQPNFMAQFAQALQLREVIDDRQKRRQLEEFLKTGDINSVEGIRQAYQISPEFGSRLSNMQGQQGLVKNRMARLEAETQNTQADTAQKKAALQGNIAGSVINRFHSLPPEQQTPQEYARLYSGGRAALLQIGLHQPEEIPEFVPLEQLEATVGGNFTPAQQETDERGRMGLEQTAANQGQMMDLRERQFAQQSGIENQGLGIRRQALANTEAFRGKQLAQGGGPGGQEKPSQMLRDLQAAGYGPDSPEVKTAMRIKYQLDPVPKQPTPGPPGAPEIQGLTPDPRISRLTAGQATAYKKLALEQDKAEEAIKQYEELINTVGTTSLPGPNKAKLENAYRNVQTQVRLLAGMGAPQAQEFAVLEAQLIPPTGLYTNAAESATSAMPSAARYDLKGSILSQLAQTKQLAMLNRGAINKRYLDEQALDAGQAPPPGAGAGVPGSMQMTSGGGPPPGPQAPAGGQDIGAEIMMAFQAGPDTPERRAKLAAALSARGLNPAQYIR